MAILAGGKEFTKLDMSHAYQQIQIDEPSKKYLRVNTHRDLFTYNRLPFCVSSSPAVYQRTMEGVLQGIPHTVACLDDILVTGASHEMHLKKPGCGVDQTGRCWSQAEEELPNSRKNPNN